MPGRLKFAKGRARGKRREVGEMNGLEKEYAALLDARKASGEVIEWTFEPEKFRLADNTFYSPDFRLLMADESLEFHETKACTSKGTPLYEDDARVKIKVAAEQHWMYRFVGAYRLSKKSGGGWKYEDFSRMS